MCGGGGGDVGWWREIPGKEEDCRTERKKVWGLEEEEEGVKQRGRQEEGERKRKSRRPRGSRERTRTRTGKAIQQSLRGGRRKPAIDSVLKPPTNNSH